MPKLPARVVFALGISAVGHVLFLALYAGDHRAKLLEDRTISWQKKELRPSAALLERLNRVHNHTDLGYHSYDDKLPRMHPFAGAMDEQGQFGYIHDEKFVRRRRWEDITLSSKSIEQVCEGLVEQNATYSNGFKSILNDDGRRIIDKIQVIPPPTSFATTPPRILCAVYTYQGKSENIRAIAETWGSRCDGFLAASTHTDPSIGAVHIPHFGTEGSYKSIWQKVRSIMAYLYEHYLDDYEFFHILGDDTYIIVENMRTFLSTLRTQNGTLAAETEVPVIAGGVIKPTVRLKGLDDFNKSFYFLSGGPGYTLNRAALKMFVSQGLERCHPNADLPYEDVLVSLCFDKLMGPDGIHKVHASTADETGAPRYHSQDPNSLVHPTYEKRFMKYQRSWRVKNMGEPVDAWDSISNTSAVFHLIKTPAYIRRLDVAFYPKYGSVAQYCRSI